MLQCLGRSACVLPACLSACVCMLQYGVVKEHLHDYPQVVRGAFKERSRGDSVSRHILISHFHLCKSRTLDRRRGSWTRTTEQNQRNIHLECFVFAYRNAEPL